MKNSGVSAPAHAYLFTKSQVRWTMVGVMLAMLLSALDQTIVGTAMPRIIADLSGFSQYTWVTSIYMITSAVTVPIVGKLTDMYGRKIFYVAGISIFVVFSLACGLSQSMTQLIIFRGLQGIGGGVMMTNAFTVIADIFPPQERGKYQGLLTSVFSFASVIGPTTGGFLTDNISWHWVFFINVPLGALVVLTFIRFFPRFKGDNQKHSIDLPGVFTLILTIVPVMLALSWGGVDYAWSSPLIIGIFVFSAVMLCLFLFFENRAKEPIIPLSLLKNRIIAISNLVSFLVGMGMFGSIVFVPLFFQGVLGSSATASGNMQIPQSIAVMIASIIAGRMISGPKAHYRILGIISMVIICLGMFWLSRLSPASQYWHVIMGAVIGGLGMGISFPVYTIVIQNTVPYNMLGVATSTNTFIRPFGGAVGLAILGSVMNNRFFTDFINRIPETVKNVIPMDSITALAHNPQALVSPEAQAQLREMLTQPGVDATVYNQVMDTLHQSLASAITGAFFIGFLILLVGLALSFFLKVKPIEKGAMPMNNPTGGTPPH
jgi:EmrB/QacA subfamily drug resistance transporter